MNDKIFNAYIDDKCPLCGSFKDNEDYHGFCSSGGKTMSLNFECVECGGIWIVGFERSRMPIKSEILKGVNKMIMLKVGKLNDIKERADYAFNELHAGFGEILASDFAYWLENIEFESVDPKKLDLVSAESVFCEWVRNEGCIIKDNWV